MNKTLPLESKCHLCSRLPTHLNIFLDQSNTTLSNFIIRINFDRIQNHLPLDGIEIFRAAMDALRIVPNSVLLGTELLRKSQLGRSLRPNVFLAEIQICRFHLEEQLQRGHHKNRTRRRHLANYSCESRARQTN